MQTENQTLDVPSRIPVTEAADLGRHLRSRFVGLDRKTPLYGGAVRTYVNLDNAATTPSLKDVLAAVVDFLGWYGSVHRGTGIKSEVSTRCYDQCRQVVAEFVGADPDYHVVIFTRSTTDSINKLACTLANGCTPEVLCTVMEHHSNLLPWRTRCRATCVGLRQADGALDLCELERHLIERRGRIRLVAVTGASNVTGLVPPLREIARMAHAYGAEIFVDAAQLAPHRPLKMGKPGDPESFDYIAFSAHKMYAPFGVGVLVGPRRAFEAGTPHEVGGGTVRLVTPDRVIWADPPAREEPGTPNVVGAVALGKAIRVLEEIGMEHVAAHDIELRAMLVEALSRLDGVKVFGEPAPMGYDRVGVVGFYCSEINHGLMAAALAHEWGIGVRHGCFCAHPYVMRLLGVKENEIDEYEALARQDDHSRFPGLVRVSLGLYNTPEEIAYTVGAIRSLIEHGPRARYVLNNRTGEYLPEEGLAPLDGCFEI